MKRLLAAVFSLSLGASALAGDWPQFRGPEGSGVGRDTELPEAWSPDLNLKWKVPLPGRGVSNPVIVGNRLFLTANSGMAMTRLHVLGFDAASGEKLWERQFWATGQTLCHPKTCMAGPTPVTDGKHVWCLFATNDLMCLNAAGDLIWYRSLNGDYPLMTNHVGRAASPILFEDLLIVPLENQGASFLVGIDAKTGVNRWKVERPLENNWTTPIVANRNGRTELILQGMRLLTGFDPRTGEKLWEVEEDGLFTIPSPVVAGDLVLAATRGMIAVKPGVNGAAPVAWKALKLGASTPSPVVHDGLVYTLKGEILVCGDIAGQGKVVWEQRLKGPFSASPVIADGKIYVVNESGVVTVLKPGREVKILATNDMKDTILATPAIANGSIYLRSDQFLYRIMSNRKRS
jgi:outer membrane protein assembly factor BamB